MQPSAFRFRSAHSRDARVLSEFGSLTFKRAFEHLYTSEALTGFLKTSRSEEAYRTYVNTAGNHLLITETPEGEIIGYTLCGFLDLPVDAPVEPARELKHLYIHPDFQSAGLGKQLLQSAIVWAANEDAAALYLGVYSENFGARRFYQRAGFQKVGEYDFLVGDHVDLEYILALKLNQ